MNEKGKKIAEELKGELISLKAKCTECGTEVKQKVTRIGAYIVCESTGFTMRWYEENKE